MTDTLNAYQLASMADVASPDSLESPGAQYLLKVYGYWQDELAESIGDAEYASDEIWAAADSLTPIYTYEIWQTFTDLAAWNIADEMVEEGIISEDQSMESRAASALFRIAETLLWAFARDAGQPSRLPDDDR